MKTLTAAERDAALACRDLADPAQGRHAIQLIVDRIEETLATAWDLPGAP